MTMCAATGRCWSDARCPLYGSGVCPLPRDPAGEVPALPRDLPWLEESVSASARLLARLEATRRPLPAPPQPRNWLGRFISARYGDEPRAPRKTRKAAP